MWWQRCDINVVAAGCFVRFCAGQVIKEASRDIGSDPLLPASRCSVSQEGQTPCRTVHPSEVQGGDGWRQGGDGRGRGLTRCATEFTRLATAGLTPYSDGKDAAGRKGGSDGAEGIQRRNGKGAAQCCFVRFCAGQVIKEASRDIGSDPL